MTFYLGIAIFSLSVIALIYLFLISPRLSNPADMELLRCDYAHRGLWNDRFPENSLPAFELAARNGYGIELDIQLSKDKRIVVFHDYDLKRMCGINKKVNELTLAELKALRLGNSGETIPTFAEVLKLVNGRVPLLVEVKGEMPQVELCHGAAYMLDKYRGPFCVESFSPLILRWFKKYRPSYARGQLVNKVGKNDCKSSSIIAFMLTHMLMNFISRPDFVAINGAYRRRLGFIICTKALRAEGFIWTVRNKKSYIDCRKAGYHTIFEKFNPKG